jgi:hypothetical protein
MHTTELAVSALRVLEGRVVRPDEAFRPLLDGIGTHARAWQSRTQLDLDAPLVCASSPYREP